MKQSPSETDLLSVPVWTIIAATLTSHFIHLPSIFKSHCNLSTTQGSYNLYWTILHWNHKSTITGPMTCLSVTDTLLLSNNNEKALIFLSNFKRYFLCSGISYAIIECFQIMFHSKFIRQLIWLRTSSQIYLTVTFNWQLLENFLLRGINRELSSSLQKLTWTWQSFKCHLRSLRTTLRVCFKSALYRYFCVKLYWRKLNELRWAY